MISQETIIRNLVSDFIVSLGHYHNANIHARDLIMALEDAGYVVVKKS